jgi:hypothetical protein
VYIHVQLLLEIGVVSVCISQHHPSIHHPGILLAQAITHNITAVFLFSCGGALLRIFLDLIVLARKVANIIDSYDSN